MTKQEFETLSGQTVSLEEFEEVNQMYNLSDMCKQEFCKNFVAMGLLSYVKAHVVALADKFKARRELYRAKERIDTLECRLAVIRTITEGGEE